MDTRSIDDSNHDPVATDKTNILPEAPKNLIIKRSKLFDDDPTIKNDLDKQQDIEILQRYIIRKFNNRVRETFHSTSAIKVPFKNNYYLRPGQVMLGDRNERPELVAADRDKYIARAWSVDPGQVTNILGVYNINDPFYGAYGNYVLNVPVGHYALAYTKNKMPLIFDAGTHVITDDFTFKFNPKTGFINQNEFLINHENIHIVRVPPGKIAKVWVKNKAYFLTSREEPYMFIDPLFRLDRNGDELFFDATTPLIVHGPKKRIIVNSGFVAVTFNCGNLDVRRPPEDNNPILIDDPNHEVVEKFLPINTATIKFPSDDMREKHKKDNPRGSELEHNNFVYTTSDNVKVGVQLAVIFEIEDPEKCIAKLIRSPNSSGDIWKDILNHIETLADIDMNSAIQQCTSQEFSSYSQTKHPNDNDRKPETPSGDANTKSFRSFASASLSDHLREYGIKLNRLNIESWCVLNSEIAKKLSEQAYKAAEWNTEAATLTQRTNVEKGKAALEATIKNTALEQSNHAIVTKSEAVLKAAENEAQAIKITAEANKQKRIKEAEGEQEAMRLVSDMYDKNPKLYERDMERLKLSLLAPALEKIQVLPQLPPGLFGTNGLYGSPFTMFNNNTGNTPSARMVEETQAVIRPRAVS